MATNFNKDKVEMAFFCNKKFAKSRNYVFYNDQLRQVSAWQSATLLPISCKSVQPVPAWVEEPVSPV